MGTRAAVATPGAGRLGVVGDYVRLTKPRVISLLLLTTLCAMFAAERGTPGGWTVLWTMIGGYLSAGGAHAINQYADRDIDARMGRTTTRPVVAGRVSPANALAFGIALGVISTLMLGLLVNWLTAGLALLGLCLYVFLYTLWLKRTSAHNIVIGGAAGAVPPLVGWAAVTGSLSIGALLLFAIVFYWTPPHFWALSLLMKDEYARVGVPMMPVVRGETETRQLIVLYTVLLVALTLMPVVFGYFGAIYGFAAIVLGGVFISLSLRLWREAERRSALRTYLFSLAYLALLFLAMVVDARL
jgi:heme o synthase